MNAQAPAADLAALQQLSLEGASADAAAAPPPPPGAPGAPPEKEISSAELFLMVGGPWFDILAPNWKVGQDEKKQLSDAYGALLDKYFPDWSTRFGPELAAVVVSAAVFGPRLAAKIPPRLPAPEEPKKEAAANAGSAEAGQG